MLILSTDRDFNSIKVRLNRLNMQQGGHYIVISIP